MLEKNTTYLTRVDNNKAKIQMNEAQRVLDDLKIEGLSDAQRIELAKLLEKKFNTFNHSIQILGGNQVIGQNQFILDKEALQGIVGDFVEVLVKYLGQEAVTEIIKEMVKVVVGKI